MTLENIVPLLADCKRIPQGAFKDSALVRVKHCENGIYKWLVMERDRGRFYKEQYPAPTVLEIMDILPRPTLDGCGCIRKWISLQRNPKNEEWIITYHNENISYSDANLATAALRMWKRLKGVQDE